MSPKRCLRRLSSLFRQRNGKSVYYQHVVWIILFVSSFVTPTKDERPKKSFTFNAYVFRRFRLIKLGSGVRRRPAADYCFGMPSTPRTDCRFEQLPPPPQSYRKLLKRTQK